MNNKKNKASKRASVYIIILIVVIVILILVFSMLGVGLYIQNKVRDKVVKQTSDDEITELVKSLKSPPSAENPFTVPKEITLKKGKYYKLFISYYNKETREAKNARIGISKCIATDGTQILFTKPSEEFTNALIVISPLQNVNPNEIKDYTIKLDDKSEMVDDNHKLNIGSYVCTMIVYNSGSEAYPDGWGEFPTSEKNNPYEKKEFKLILIA